MDADQQALSGATYDVILFKGDQHLNETHRSNQTAAMQKYTFQRFRKLEDYLNYLRSIVQFYIMLKMFILNYGSMHFRIIQKWLSKQDAIREEVRQIVSQIQNDLGCQNDKIQMFWTRLAS
jgi:hypothetical protein